MKNLTKKNIFDLISTLKIDINVESIYKTLKKKSDLELEIRKLNNKEVNKLLDLAMIAKNSKSAKFKFDENVNFSVVNKSLKGNNKKDKALLDYFYQIFEEKNRFFDFVVEHKEIHGLASQEFDIIKSQNDKLQKLQTVMSDSRSKEILEKIEENKLDFDKLLKNPFLYSKLEERRKQILGEDYSFKSSNIIFTDSQADSLSLIENNFKLRLNYLAIKSIYHILEKSTSTYAPLYETNTFKVSANKIERTNTAFINTLSYYLNLNTDKVPHKKISDLQLLNNLDKLSEDYFKVFEDKNKNNKVFIKRIFDDEIIIEKSLRELIKNTRFVKKGEFNEKATYDNKVTRDGVSIELSQEQMLVARKVAALKSGFAVITGPAGSGKTTVTEKVLDLRFKMGINSENDLMLFGAPMGIAAIRLSDALKKEAITVHKIIQKDIRNAKLILIDEVGFADMHIIKKLLEKVNLEETLVIFLGDKAQLSPVEEGMILRDIEENFYNDKSEAFEHFYNLKTVFRQGSESNILKFANNILNGKSFAKAGDDLIFEAEINDSNVISLLDDYDYFKSDISQVQILSIMKEGQGGVKMINSLVQREFAKRFNKKEFINYIFNGKAQKLYVGDKVISTRKIILPNKREICNGEMGIVKAIKDNAILVELEGVERLLTRDLLTDIDLAYCTSVHKVQGGGWDTVIFLMQKKHIYLANRNLLYTGVTRAKKRLILCSEPRTINVAVYKQEINRRKTDIGNKLQ